MSPGTSAVELHKGRAKIVHCEQKGKNFWMDSLRFLPQRDAIGGSDTSLPFLCYQPALSRQAGTSLFPSGSGSCQRSRNLSGQWPIADHSDTFFSRRLCGRSALVRNREIVLEEDSFRRSLRFLASRTSRTGGAGDARERG